MVSEPYRRFGQQVASRSVHSCTVRTVSYVRLCKLARLPISSAEPMPRAAMFCVWHRDCQAQQTGGPVRAWHCHWQDSCHMGLLPSLAPALSTNSKTRATHARLTLSTGRHVSHRESTLGAHPPDAANAVCPYPLPGITASVNITSGNTTASRQGRSRHDSTVCGAKCQGPSAATGVDSGVLHR